MMSKAEYQKYLQSTWWQGRRERRLKVAEGRCEFRPEEHFDGKHLYLGDRCVETKRLEVHHKHYEIAVPLHLDHIEHETLHPTAFLDSHLNQANCLILV
jgi:hypothetical protein